MTASASVVVPVGLLNEAAGLLELEGYGPVSMGLLSCLTHPAEQDAREAVHKAVLGSVITTEFGTAVDIAHLTAAVSALTQAAPDGRVLVPVEPTREMIEAFRDWYALHFGRPIMKGKARKIVTRMLSASPAPPAQGAGS